MEREPVAFFARDLEPALDAARAALGAFVGADPDDLAFVTNATTGINTWRARSRLEPGDEVVVLDHAYNAARNALGHGGGERAGARVVTAAIPFPGRRRTTRWRRSWRPSRRARGSSCSTTSPARRRSSSRSRRSSPRSPRAGSTRWLTARTRPGMLDVDVDAHRRRVLHGELPQVDVRAEGRGLPPRAARPPGARIRPLVISHGANSPRTDRTRFRLEHDWTGTLDPSAWLAVPAAIGFGATVVPGGWAELRARGHRLALAGRAELTRVLGTDTPAPDEMIGSMAAVPMPSSGRSEPPVAEPDEDPVHAALLAAGVQVAVTAWPRDPGGGAWGRLIRFSCAPYVDATDLGRLVAALAALRVAV